MQRYGNRYGKNTEYTNYPYPYQSTDPSYEPRWRDVTEEKERWVGRDYTGNENLQQLADQTLPTLPDQDQYQKATSYTPQAQQYQRRYDWGYKEEPLYNQALGAMMKQNQGVDISVEEYYQALKCLVENPKKEMEKLLQDLRQKRAAGLIPPRQEQVLLELDKVMDPQTKHALMKTYRRVCKGKPVADDELRMLEALCDKIRNTPITRSTVGNVFASIKKLLFGPPIRVASKKPITPVKPTPPVTHEGRTFDVKNIITKAFYWISNPTDTAFFVEPIDFIALYYAAIRNQMPQLIAGDGKLNLNTN
jgi:hypothetical protein